MSRAKQICMEISESPDYLALVAAVESGDYPTAVQYYNSITKRVKEFHDKVVDGVISATRIKDWSNYLQGHALKDLQQYRDAFEREAAKLVPLWFNVYQKAREVTKEVKEGGEGSQGS